MCFIGLAPRSATSPIDTHFPIGDDAERRGIPIVEVNPEPALPRTGYSPSAANRRDLPAATVVLAGFAGDVLPRLLRLDTPS